MGINLFRRRSRQRMGGESKLTNVSTVGVHSPGTEKSYESYDAREVLFPKNSRKSSGKFNIVSPRTGANNDIRVSDVRDSSLHGGYKRASTVPTARESAYSGPPRYDWIDVEAAAAIKIQSIYRRHQVLAALEKEGKSTAAMRNRIRARNAKKISNTSEDVPLFFRFCGVGLLFSDVTGEDDEFGTTGDDAYHRNSKLKAFRMRQKPTVEVDEAVEVVDDVDYDQNIMKKKKGFRGFKSSKKQIVNSEEEDEMAEF